MKTTTRHSGATSGPRRIVCLTAALTTASASALEVEELWRVSVATDSSQACCAPRLQVAWGQQGISWNGRFVSFWSGADLVPDDTNDSNDAFLHDLTTGETFRVNLATDGSAAPSPSSNISEATAVSDAGDVVFFSRSSSLVEGDTNEANDAFVHSIGTGETTRVSVSSTGGEGQGRGVYGLVPAITPDGRYVVFTAELGGLVPGEDGGVAQIYRHDRWLHETVLVSVDDAGLALGGSDPDITPDGRYVAFVGPYGADFADVHVKDMATGVLWRVFEDDIPGFAINPMSPAISDDGRFIAFQDPAGIRLSDRALQTTTVLLEGGFRYPDISGDGRFVTAYTDDCLPSQVVLHDRTTGETIRVSVGPDGRAGNLPSEIASISGDGRLIAFGSDATNLIDGDTNDLGDIFVARIGDGDGPRGRFDWIPDTDMDGIDDDCDRDDDADGIDDWYENRHGLDPLDPSDASLDGDGDGLTSRQEFGLKTYPLDADTDDDTVLDGADNCPLDSNTDQANFDGDSEGDVCDIDDDNDKVMDSNDAFPFDATRSSASGSNPPPNSSPPPTPTTPAPTALSGGGGAFGLLSLLGLLCSLVLISQRRKHFSRR